MKLLFSNYLGRYSYSFGGLTGIFSLQLQFVSSGRWTIDLMPVCLALLVCACFESTTISKQGKLRAVGDKCQVMQQTVLPFPDPGNSSIFN